MKELVVTQAPYIAIAASMLSLLFAVYLIQYITRQNPGNERVRDLSGHIQSGASTFMNREFTYLSGFAVVVAVVLYTLPGTGIPTALGFVAGTIASSLAGWIGMWIATRSNGRTAHAARSSFVKALNIAYSGGATMGFSVVGLGLLGLTITYILYPENSHAWLGYAFGSSSVALFLRVGGGVYTKSADVGADVVGKVEEGIPEDDPRNAGTIADNVGDNVGDVAGMGSDLYESYVSAVAATMVLGKGLGPKLAIPDLFVHLALLLGIVGIIGSIVGTFFVRTTESETDDYSDQTRKAQNALNWGTYAANFLTVVLALGLLFWIIPGGHPVASVIEEAPSGIDVRWGLFIAMVAGLLTGVIIGLATEYYTSDDYAPVRAIAQSSTTGTATTIIEGLGTGMISTIIPAVTVSLATLVAFYFAGLYGIALGSMGMLLTLGIVLSMDAYGPITDNAAGIAEMSNLGEKVRERCEALDSVGNTTAAIGKGFAIGSAALAALAWLATFFSEAEVYLQDQGVSVEYFLNPTLVDPSVLVGLLLGVMLTFYLSAIGLRAISRGASKVVEEVRRQFNETEGILEGETTPDYQRCVDITTTTALKEMMIPGIVVIVSPILLGVIPGLGFNGLAGLLAGVLVSGFLTAIFMSNSGAAWDNAKKYIESGVHGGKGSESHRASVVGDTVGDPFKDTSGPSLNVLIKLMGKVAVIFLPLFAWMAANYFP